MKTCYLHVGHAKTATSSLQTFMHKHEQLFEAHGIWVPGDYRAFKSFDCRAIAAAGRNFAGNFGPVFNARVAKNDDLFDALLDHVLSRDTDVLLSSELVFYYKHFVREVLKTANQRGFAVTVIAYLRRQDRTVVPAYYQNIRNHGYHKGLADFLEDTAEMSYFRYAEVIGQYGVAPPNRLVLRTFEPEFLAGGDIIADFAAILGLDVPADDTDRPQARANQSLPLETLEILRALNALNRLDLVRQIVLLPAPPQPGGSRRAWSYYYDAQVADAVAERFMPGNTALVADYMQDRGAAERAYWQQPPDAPVPAPQLDPDGLAAVLASLLPAQT